MQRKDTSSNVGRKLNKGFGKRKISHMIVVKLFTTTEVLNETYKESWHFFPKEMSIAAGFVLSIKRRQYTTDKKQKGFPFTNETLCQVMKILVPHYCLLDDVTIFLMERYSELKLDWLKRRKKEKKNHTTTSSC